MMPRLHPRHNKSEGEKMNVNEALEHFKSAYELAIKIGAHGSAVGSWKRDLLGWIPVQKQLLINQVLGLDLPIDLTKPLLQQRLASKDIINKEK